MSLRVGGGVSREPSIFVLHENSTWVEPLRRAFAERKGVKLGNVAQPLRAALTGRTTSPPIFDVLAVLG